MEHNTVQFKTNINCSGCVASVKPHLDKAAGIAEWSVDTSTKEKILTIKSAGITSDEIVKTVQKAGFNIAPLQGS